jgi:hypothetical protein
MKFLIQKCNGKLVHDFSFTLLQTLEYLNWINDDRPIKHRFINTDITSGREAPIAFKDCHKSYTPVGSVEFVSQFLKRFYGLTPKPINIPLELFGMTNRKVFNGTDADVPKDKTYIVKSNDVIKGYMDYVHPNHHSLLTKGNYQISEVIDIESEWRCFVYHGKLVGLQNYTGDFTVFPNVDVINDMIRIYKSAPVAYTLDVGVCNQNTFVIEVHDFFSCGLYGFNDPQALPYMLHRWFNEYIS